MSQTVYVKVWKIRLYRPHICSFFLIMPLVLISLTAAAAEDNAGQLVDMSGDVLFSQDQGRRWTKPVLNMLLPEGSCIKTGSSASAALLLRDRSQIRLNSDTVLCLERAGTAPDSPGFIQGIYRVLKGEMWFRNKRRGPKPVFRTPMVTAAIRGTEMVITVRKDRSEITGLEGRIRCFNPHGEITICRGEAAVAETGRSPRLVKILRPEGKAQWLLVTPDITGPAERGITSASPAFKYVSMARQAMNELIRGRRDRALALAQKAAAAAPESPACNTALATVLQAAGGFEQALPHALRAVELDSASASALVRAVELLMGLDRVEQARSLITAFRGDDDPRVMMLKGYIMLIDLDPQKALNLFTKATEAAPGLAPAHMGIALALYQTGRTCDGTAAMEKACLLDPLAAYPHCYLGKALYARGERDEAEIELRRAVQLDPFDPSPFLYLATVYSDAQMPGKAITAFEKSLELNNNRFASRSRFLLDRDRAVRNISLAWAFHEMGLTDWSDSKGNLAVWDDPTSSSAYLLRTFNAVSLRSADSRSVADLQKYRLLQPVNANTYISYQNYQGLLEYPAWRGKISAEGGGDKSFDTSLWLQGGTIHTAGALYGNYHTTNGPVSGASDRGESGDMQVKYNINPDNQIYLYGHGGYTRAGDLILSRADGRDMNPWDNSGSHDSWVVQTGYHRHQGPGRDLLLTLQSDGGSSQYALGADADFPLTKQGYDSDLYENVWRLQGLQFWRLGSHRLHAGGLLKDGYWHESGTEYYRSELPWFNREFPFADSNHMRDYRAYAGDIWHINDYLMLQLGVEWCRQDGYWHSSDSSEMIRDEALPRVGIVFTPSGSDTLRLAMFQELQPDNFSSTLQPVEVAGFSTVTGALPGSWTWFYGMGWDRQWNSTTFTRAVAYRQDRRYASEMPDIYMRAGPWKNDRVLAGRMVIEHLLAEQVAVRFQYSILHLKIKDSPERKRLDQQLDLGITWVHPSGWHVRFVAGYLDQDEYSGYSRPMGDSFFVLNSSVRKYLFDKKGELFLKWENMTGKEYRYVPYELSEIYQLPWQGGRVMAGLVWNF